MTAPGARVSKLIRFRPGLVRRLQAAARVEHQSFNWIVNQACADYVRRRDLERKADQP